MLAGRFVDSPERRAFATEHRTVAEAAEPRMRIFVHDYAGHAFPVQLSRWLARRGHEVLHTYSADLDSPRGALARTAEDPAGFQVEALSLGTELRKYDPVRRLAQELRYARAMARRVVEFAPDAVLSSNSSAPIQHLLRRAARRRGARFVYWLQDITSMAARPVLRRRFPGLGGALAWGLSRYEFRMLARSDAVIAISEDFVPLCLRHHVAPAAISVIENWAPIDEITPMPRDNPWARRQGLVGKFVFLYSGTLGLKHDPALLADLAESLRGEPEARVVVISRGLGRNWLADAKAARGLDNLLLFDYQPYEDLPAVLASGDVLIAILEPHAGHWSVPSKVLSYLCTERPVLAAMPWENLAARVVARAGAGVVVAPSDAPGFLAGARHLYADAAQRQAFALNARAYAQRAFDIETIGGQFLAALSQRQLGGHGAGER
jgi:glycosyltransferase involved in cell wall biosynthesis